jgi:hypothetical protein
MRRVDSGQLDEAGNPLYVQRPVIESVQLPVDYRGLKASVKPLLEETLRPMSIAQEQSSTGIKALRNILDAPDFVPASVADQDLGALKGIMRESPQSRSVAQAKFAADQLSRAVDAAVERAGPDAVEALRAGREATTAKYRTQDFQRNIGFRNVGTSQAEPGSAVDLVSKLTRDGDRSIALLRSVQEHTPEHVPALAQAVTQQLIDSATAEAGTAKPGAALTKWQKMGDQTKSILYRDPKQIQNLTDWFTLSKRLAENPNPSGSAQVLAFVKGVGLMLTAPHVGVPLALGSRSLARVLFNSRGSRLLATAARMPAAGPAAAAIGEQLVKAAGGVDAIKADSAAAAPAPAASADTVVTVPGQPKTSGAFGAPAAPSAPAAPAPGDQVLNQLFDKPAARNALAPKPKK